MKLPARHLLTVDRWFSPMNRLIRGRSFSSGQETQSGRAAIIKLMGLGSIIRLLSLCQVRQVDFSRTVLITFASNREACQLVGIDRCLFIRTNNPFHFVLDCAKAFFAMNKMKPDWIIDFERCSNIVSLFRRCLAFTGGSSTLAFDDLDPVQSRRHEVLNINQYSYYEMLLKGIDRMAVAPLPKAAETKHAKDSTKIVVNINCSDYLLARRYPRHLFHEVIEGLNVRQDQLTFYLTGAATERAYVAELASALERSGVRVHNVAGQWTLTEFHQALLTSGLFISGDSGPLHLAIHLGVPTLAVWGPTRPQHFGYRDGEFLANVSENLPCAPCFLHPRSKPAVFCQGRISCMQDLAPNTIVCSAQKLLQHATPINNFTPAAPW